MFYCKSIFSSWHKYDIFIYLIVTKWYHMIYVILVIIASGNDLNSVIPQAIA